MTEEYAGKERRRFLRYPYNKPIKYKILKTNGDKNLLSRLLIAISKNLSAAGILFTTNVSKIPEIASLVALDIDYKTVSVCQEIEARTLILKDKIIGRVVRIEDNEDGTARVGVAFVTKSDPLSERLKDLEPLIKE